MHIIHINLNGSPPTQINYLCPLLQVRSPLLLTAYLVEGLNIEMRQAMQAIRVRPGCMRWSWHPVRQKRHGTKCAAFEPSLVALERLTGQSTGLTNATDSALSDANVPKGPLTIQICYSGDIAVSLLS